MKSHPRLSPLLAALLVTICGCAPGVVTDISSTPTATRTPAITVEAAPTATAQRPQATATPFIFDPNALDAPLGVNPLTGLDVTDPQLLGVPALLVSIPHFPPQARPQSGLSFAPWVFEYLIATGSTRLLAVFHGEYPRSESSYPTGDCEVRSEPFADDGSLLGNRVWLDMDTDGVQDPAEPGVAGVCVRLLEAGSSRLLDTTSTDSNGFYAFNVDGSSPYIVEFGPGMLTFAPPDQGLEDTDSDANPATGRTGTIHVDNDLRIIDAGLRPPGSAAEFPSDVGGQVGPVRSARLLNVHVQHFFQDSCLIHAGSARQLRDVIPHCADVFQRGDGGVGAMLPLPRLVAIAEDHDAKRDRAFNYASNVFAETPPAGGRTARRVDVYAAELNQSAWIHDSALQGWVRLVDKPDPAKPGDLHLDVDRLTGRTLYVANLIVLFVEHEVLAPAIMDMHMEQGETGPARFFRDGRVFEGSWSTRGDAYERTTGLRKPIAFLDEHGEPFPLRPGRTWIIVVTPYSPVTEASPGNFRLRIVAPEGAGIY